MSPCSPSDFLGDVVLGRVGRRATSVCVMEGREAQGCVCQAAVQSPGALTGLDQEQKRTQQVF